MELSNLTRVDVRSVWTHAANGFTPWLAENIHLLSAAIGIDLEVQAQEKPVGIFRADILCEDIATGDFVLIENQLERTDHVHLGQLITYASGLQAVTVIWLSSEFAEEHRAALDWLNEITSDSVRFFGLEIELYQIGDSPVAPKFNIVCKPNDWKKRVARVKRSNLLPNGEMGEKVRDFIDRQIQSGNIPTLGEIMKATGCSKGTSSRYRAEMVKNNNGGIATSGSE